MNRIILILAVILTTIPLLATEWVEIDPPEGANGGLSYQFISATEGWAFSSNYDGTLLYHTNNTGQSWEQIYVSDQNQIIDLQMIDSQHGWAILYGSNSTNLFTTINGGEDWFRVNVQVPIYGHVTAMDFSDMENGLIAGLSEGISYLYRTTNGGYDLENLYEINNSFEVRNITCLDEVNIWVSGSLFDGIAIYSSNEGVDWDFIGNSIENSDVKRFHFSTDQIYGFTGNFIIDGDFLGNVLILTDDGMDTYTLLDDSVFGENVYSCYFMDEQTIWVGGSDNMFISTNGGRTFSIYQNFDTNIKDITFIDSTGFATGGNGSLYVYHPAVSNDEATVEVPILEFNCYPNPFNPETTISFNNPQNGRISLSIYNIKGQLVKTLLDEEIAVGTHSIVWNGTNEKGISVTSGIYFAKITNTTSNSLTKKMILMK